MVRSHIRVARHTVSVKIIRVETGGIRLRIVTPPRDLAPFITAYYHRSHVRHHGRRLASTRMGQSARGCGKVYEAAIGEAAMQQLPTAVISGPTSRVTRLGIADGEFWGVGLLPLGFARFVGVPASMHADRFCDAARNGPSNLCGR